MLLQTQLLTLLDKALGQSARLRKGTEAIYYCPFCHHYKKKLEVNTVTQEWHCWVCNAAGKSIRSLFRKLKVHRAFFAELYKIVGKPEFIKNQQNFGPIQQDSSLPDGFLPLSRPSKSLEFGNAISYLRSRGVTRDDILRYNIGYAEQGEFKQRVIIPSYDKDGNLNFFSSRIFYDNDETKYRNPSWSKDIIGFELFINWDEPITLVEGAFDALAIRRNVIPLFGTLMSNRLKEAIIENGVGQVNIVLDNDALRKALDIYDFLEKQEVEAKIIKLEDKDPSVLGYERITEIINSTQPMDFSALVLLKMNT